MQHFNTEAPYEIKDIILKFLEIILKKYYVVFKTQNGVTKSILLILQKYILTLNM